MATEKVTWTVLPKAISTRGGKTSVIVSLLANPCLTGADKLASFPTFVDWPANFVLAKSTWTIRTNEATPLTFKLADTTELKNKRWTSVFGPGTPVVAPKSTRPLKGRRFASFDILTMHRAMQLELGRVVAEITSAPSPLDTDDFDVFYSPRKTTEKPKCPEPEPFDFHSFVNMASHHPSMMRALGLVIDLELVNVADFFANAQKTGTLVFAAPAGHVSQVTAYTIEQGANQCWTFLPSSSTDVDKGLMRLRGYQPIAMDVDGSAFKQKTGGRLGPQPGTPHPSTRTGGISLIQSGRAKAIEERLAARARASGPLGAHELLRGFRVDVWDGKVWRSLCRRDAEYELFSGPPLSSTPGEESLVPFVITTQRDDARDSPDLPRLHEALFLWDGWSLGAELPWNAFKEPDSDCPKPKLPYKPWKSMKTMAPKPSKPWEALPRLRFGRAYSFRLRATDPAGNGLPPPSATDATEAPAVGSDVVAGPVPYLRYEPIGPLVVVPSTRPDAFGRGETVDRVVMRDGSSNDPIRHVMPPAVTPQFAEAHGSFEEYFARLDSPVLQSYARLCESDAAPPEHDDNDEARVTFLPDPLATRPAVFVRYNGGEEAEIANAPPFLENNTWPDARSFCVKLVDGPVFTCKFQGRTLRVEIPRGNTCTVRVASKVDDAGLLAPLKAAREALLLEGEHTFRERIDVLTSAVEAGDNESVTPSRTIALVNAVATPPLPSFVNGGGQVLTRAAGSTDASVAEPVQLHWPSTTRIDLECEWTDIVDDVTKAMPDRNRTMAKHAGDQVILPEPSNPNGETTVPIAFIQHVGDTRQRVIRYTAVATTRFAEHYKDGATKPSRSKPVSRIAPATVRPPAPIVRETTPVTQWLRSSPNSGHQITERMGNGLRLYLGRPWYVSGNEEKLALVLSTGTEPPSVNVSRWGVDPLWMTPERVGDLRLDHLVHLAGAQMVPHVEVGPNKEPVALALFDPVYDEATQQWVIDLDFDAKDSYFRFVRLALARYQKYAVDGCQLSEIVVAEGTQLLPYRRATARRLPDGRAHAELAGPFPRDAAGAPQKVQVVAALERFDLGVWIPHGPELAFDRKGEAFEAIFTRPDTILTSYRLVIKEFEVYADASPTPSPLGGDGRRLVFTDFLKL
jgi:hypothetical protein